MRWNVECAFECELRGCEARGEAIFIGSSIWSVVIPVIPEPAPHRARVARARFVVGASPVPGRSSGAAVVARPARTRVVVLVCPSSRSRVCRRGSRFVRDRSSSSSSSSSSSRGASVSGFRSPSAPRRRALGLESRARERGRRVPRRRRDMKRSLDDPHAASSPSTRGAGASGASTVSCTAPRLA